MLNTSANKAVYGAGSIPALYVLKKTAEWFWPELQSLLTEEYMMALSATITGLVVWFVPNKKEGLDATS